MPSSPAPSAPQWCYRRLLARIHRYTVKRLRAEIEPVQARDFLRFLFDWQRVTPARACRARTAVAAVLAQLEGFDAPASAWETEVLPMRIAEYEPAWLDEQCLAGRIVWTRLASRDGDAERGAAPVRSTPIALLARTQRAASGRRFTAQTEHAQLTPKAQQVAEFIHANGASFFDEIVEDAGLLPNQVEEALGELVALGLVNSDSFGGLRALLAAVRSTSTDRTRRAPQASHRDLRHAGCGTVGAGAKEGLRGVGLRATSQKRNRSEPLDLQPEPRAPQPRVRPEAVEHVCRTLLRRWGVVFWKLIAARSRLVAAVARDAHVPAPPRGAR